MGKPKDMQAAQCQLCGKRFSRAGLTGHMRFKHGRDPKAPMVPVERPVGRFMSALGLEKAVIALFNGRELKDAQGVVLGRFKVKKGARKAYLYDPEGKPTGKWLAAGEGEAEKALLQLQK